METNKSYIELITRYFSGEASGTEMQELADWVKSAPVNRKIFDEYRRTWLSIEGSSLEAAVNTNREWEQFFEKRSENKKTSRFFILSPFMSRVVRIAAIALIVLIPAFFLYLYFTPAHTEKVIAERSMTETILPDGTQVTLNSGSFIEFPNRFDRNIREVKLSGEAYFEVHHDPAKPFIISIGGARIRVVGTAFNVNTHVREGCMEVVLTHGKVALYYIEKPAEQLMLVPGEKAELFKGQALMRKSINQDENYMAWKTKKFIFSNKTLGVVVHDLNNVYHTDIRLMNGSLSSCRLTATFDNQTIESILNVLQSTLDIGITRKGSTVEINGHGCE